MTDGNGTLNTRQPGFPYCRVFNVFFPDFFILLNNREMKKKTYAGLQHRGAFTPHAGIGGDHCMTAVFTR
jgi:hypothetical protein